MNFCECCGQPIVSDVERVLETVTWSPSERKVLDRLMRSFGKDVDTSTLIDAVYGDRADGGPDTARKAVTVFVHNIRPRLAPLGLAIAGGSGRRFRRLTALPRDAAP